MAALPLFVMTRLATNPVPQSSAVQPTVHEDDDGGGGGGGGGGVAPAQVTPFTAKLDGFTFEPLYAPLKPNDAVPVGAMVEFQPASLNVTACPDCETTAFHAPVTVWLPA